jgi:pilus assembly protein Flp/PilA
MTVINLDATWVVLGSAHGRAWATHKNRAPDLAQTVKCGPMELNMKKLVTRFVNDESGATAIEYGLIAAGISVAIIAVVQGLGSKLNTTFTSVQTALK